MAKTISVKSLGGTASRVEVTNQTGGGVTFGATLSGNAITVTMAAGKGIQAGHRQGILRIYNAGGTEIAHAAVYTLIK